MKLGTDNTRSFRKYKNTRRMINKLLNEQWAIEEMYRKNFKKCFEAKEEDNTTNQTMR